jgi:acyl-CoA thioesterase
MPELVDNPLEFAREIVGKDPMASFLGVEVEEVRKAYARTSLTIRPDYLNAAERAHGVAVFAVADQAFAVACNSTGYKALALHTSMSYLAAALDGEKIFAEASPVHVGNKVSTWKIEVRGSADKLIATGEGIAYHK